MIALGRPILQAGQKYKTNPPPHLITGHDGSQSIYSVKRKPHRKIRKKNWRKRCGGEVESSSQLINNILALPTSPRPLQVQTARGGDEPSNELRYDPSQSKWAARSCRARRPWAKTMGQTSYSLHFHSLFPMGETTRTEDATASLPPQCSITILV